MSPEPTPLSQPSDALDTIITAAQTLSGVAVGDVHVEGVRAHLANSLMIAEKIGVVGADAAPSFRP